MGPRLLWVTRDPVLTPAGRKQIADYAFCGNDQRRVPWQRISPAYGTGERNFRGNHSPHSGGCFWNIEVHRFRHRAWSGQRSRLLCRRGFISLIHEYRQSPVSNTGAMSAYRYGLTCSGRDRNCFRRAVQGLGQVRQLALGRTGGTRRLGLASPPAGSAPRG
jgi:hypothetical protein